MLVIGGLIAACVAILAGLGCVGKSFYEGPNEDLIEYAVSNVPEVSQFVSVFPNAQHAVTYRTGEMGQPAWTSEALVYERYLIVMTASAEIDEDEGAIRLRHSPRYLVTEIVRLQDDSMYHGQSWEFGEEKWKQIFDSNGDLHILSERIERNNRVPGLAQWWSALRP